MNPQKAEACSHWGSGSCPAKASLRGSPREPPAFPRLPLFYLTDARKNQSCLTVLNVPKRYLFTQSRGLQTVVYLLWWARVLSYEINLWKPLYHFLICVWRQRGSYLIALMVDTIAKLKACFRFEKQQKNQPSESSSSAKQPEEQDNNVAQYFPCVCGISIYFCIILRLYCLCLKIAKSLLGFSSIIAT